MFNKIKGLSKNDFVKNVMIMATGTASAQAITMLLSPVITRIYGPEAYGLMGVFMAIAVIIAPVASLTYPSAIVLPKDDRDANILIKLSIYLSLAIAFIITMIILLLNEQIVSWLNLKDIAGFLFLIPIVILNAGFLQVVEQWLIRTKQFKVSAKAVFVQSIFTQGGKVGIGLLLPLTSVLIIVSAVAEGIKALFMILFSKNMKLDKILMEKVSITEIKLVAKKYIDFPVYRAPQVFVNASSQSLPVLLLSAFFGPAAAGFYTIGKTVLSIPSQLIGKSVGDVFYPRISEASNNGENITSLIKKATLTLGVVGIIPYGTVIIFGPWLFGFVFGDEWVVAGEYARWMAIWVYFMFINQPSVKTLPILSAQKFHLIFTVFTLITRTVALVIGYYVFKSDLVAVALFGVSGALLNLLLVFITIQLSKKFDTRQLKGDK